MMVCGSLVQSASAALPPLQELAPAGQNLVTNGSFDTDTSFWSLDDNSNYTEDGRLGGGVQLTTDSETTSRAVYSLGDIALAPGQTYTMSAWVKTDTGVSANLIFSSVQGNNLTEQQVISNSTSYSGDWTEISVTFNTHASEYIYSRIILEAYKQEAAGNVYFDNVSIIANGSEWLATRSANPGLATEEFFDDFDGPLDPEKWLIPSKAWGGANNGIVPENLELTTMIDPGTNTEISVIKLHSYGDLNSDTSIVGVNASSGGTQEEVSGIDPISGGRDNDAPKTIISVPNNTRVGAGLATRDYFASGSYKVRALIPNTTGVVTAFWTFHYFEDEELIDPNDPLSGKIRNTEIDWEFPTSLNDGRNPDPISFDNARLNTWGGKAPGEGAHHPGRFSFIDNGLSPPSDEQFHEYEFKWFSTAVDGPIRLEWWYDGIHIYTHDSYNNPAWPTPDVNIGERGARYWIANWFAASEYFANTGGTYTDEGGTWPKLKRYTGWGGDPDFSKATTIVDWVKITPYNLDNDRFDREGTPNLGWALPHRYPGFANCEGGDCCPTESCCAANECCDDNCEPSTIQWTHISGQTSQNDGVLSLVGNPDTSRASLLNVAVTPGNHTLTAVISNSNSNSWTYVGIEGTGEKGSTGTAEATVNLEFNATGNAVTIYGSFWKGQPGTGFIKDVRIDGVLISLPVSPEPEPEPGPCPESPFCEPDGTGWVGVSGNVNITGSSVELLGSALTARVEQVFNVTAGQNYTLTGDVHNSDANLWTYIGLINGGQVIEKGNNLSSPTAIEATTFTAQESTVTVYGSFYKGQSGSGFIQSINIQ